MGQLIVWLGRGLYLGGGAIIGLLFEKISAAVAGILPANVNVQGKDGKLAWWFIMAVSIAAGIVLYIVTKAITGKKKLLTLALLLCGLLDMFYGGGFDVIAASLLFSIAASSTESKSIPFCPEFITFNIATVPTAFKIEVVGDGVVFSLDGAGLTNLNGIRCVGALPTGQYLFQVANGFISKNTTFTVANAQAAQLDVYGFSNSKGNAFVLHNMAKAFANASLTIPSPFLYAAFPSAAATDSFTVTFADGTVQNMTRLELVSYISYKQQVADARYNLDNYEREIAQIQFIGAADQNVYYQRGNRAFGSGVNQAL
jgi:hypothetical protein